MPDDIPILRSVRKSTQMGCHGIRAVLDESPNREIRTALRRQLAEYEELFCEADRLLHERGEKGRDISAVARLGSLTVSRMRVRTSPEPEAKIAELMVQGNTRGMLKSLHNMRTLDAVDPKISSLSTRLLQTEQANIDEMMRFL